MWLVKVLLYIKVCHAVTSSHLKIASTSCLVQAYSLTNEVYLYEV